MFQSRCFSIARQYVQERAFMSLKLPNFKKLVDTSVAASRSLNNCVDLRPTIQELSVGCMSLGTYHDDVVGSKVTQQQRRFIHMPNPFRKKQNFQLLDKVPISFECVYNASSLGLYIAYGYPIIAAIFAAALGLGVSTFSSGATVIQLPNFSSPSTDLEILAACPIAGFLCYLAGIVAHRSPLRIYYNEEHGKFLAIFATLFPWRVSKVEFFSGDVCRIYADDDDVSSTVRVFRGEYMLGKKRLAIHSHLFKYPYHYNIMMGYIWKDE